MEQLLQRDCASSSEVLRVKASELGELEAVVFDGLELLLLEELKALVIWVRASLGKKVTG